MGKLWLKQTAMDALPFTNFMWGQSCGWIRWRYISPKTSENPLPFHLWNGPRGTPKGLPPAVNNSLPRSGARPVAIKITISTKRLPFLLPIIFVGKLILANGDQEFSLWLKQTAMDEKLWLDSMEIYFPKTSKIRYRSIYGTDREAPPNNSALAAFRITISTKRLSFLLQIIFAEMVTKNFPLCALGGSSPARFRFTEDLTAGNAGDRGEFYLTIFGHCLNCRIISQIFINLCYFNSQFLLHILKCDTFGLGHDFPDK